MPKSKAVKKAAKATPTPAASKKAAPKKPTATSTSSDEAKAPTTIPLSAHEVKQIDDPIPAKLKVPRDPDDARFVQSFEAEVCHYHLHFHSPFYSSSCMSLRLLALMLIVLLFA
jgi:hypothetical protein